MTARGQVKGNGRTPRFVVTFSRGNGACISPISGMSQTSPKPQEYPPVRIPTIPATHSERRRPRIGAERRWATSMYLSGYDGRRLPVPQAIKRARKKLKLTQRQLAERLGFKDHTLISKYEKGQRVPSDKVIQWLKEGGM